MQTSDTSQNKIKKLKLDFKDSKYATGRRKRSIAKVWVKKGSGKIFVNGKLMGDYFKRPVHQLIVTRPLEITNVINNYDVKKIVLFDAIKPGQYLNGNKIQLIINLSNARL